MSFLNALIKPSTRERGTMDVTLAAVVIALLGFGVVMVYSASVIEATVVFRDPQYFLKRQAVYAGASFALMLVLSHIDYHHYRRFTYPILGVVTFLMVLSVIGFGHTGGGAARWLAIGPIHIQPSEAAKLALVLWLAYSLE
jgi:cell division protein FtsW